jgi:hypothetical protein
MGRGRLHHLAIIGGLLLVKYGESYFLVETSQCRIDSLW